MPSRFVFAALGTRGDLYPYLAICRELIRRGHDVVFAAAEQNRTLVEKIGASFRRLGPDVVLTEKLLVERGVSIENVEGEMFVRDLLYPRVEETYRDLLAAAESGDMLVFPMFIFPGPMAAERLGIPYVVTHAAPASFNSFYDPPYLPLAPWMYPLQRMSPIVPRLFHPIAKRFIRSWAKPLHELRAREGFPRDSRDLILDGMDSPWLTLGLFSEALGAPQKDWPQPSLVTGFPFYDEEQRKRTMRFLDEGEPPLVATLGSVLAKTRESFLEATVAAASRLGKRLLLIDDSVTSHQQERFARDIELEVVSYAPYSEVFPRASALLLAGSVGSISHGLRAGKPMLVTSAEQMPDQPDNALRMQRLGVARWLPLQRYTADRVEKELCALLTQRDYAIRAAELGERVRREDGVSVACDALEQTLECIQRKTI